MTMLPASTDFTGATKTEAEFKTAITALRTFLFEKLGDDGSVAIQAFATGTKMLFQQTAAPTGWTKDTTHNDKALRVVSGTASSGGTTAFSTIFGKTATDAHTLTVAQMPLHGHPWRSGFVSEAGGGGFQAIASSMNVTNNDAYTGALGDFPSTHLGGSGGGGSHTHGMDIRVQYVDLIICQKD
jgi:hypothetical protein